MLCKEQLIEIHQKAIECNASVTYVVRLFSEQYMWSTASLGFEHIEQLVNAQKDYLD